MQGRPVLMLSNHILFIVYSGVLYFEYLVLDILSDYVLTASKLICYTGVFVPYGGSFDLVVVPCCEWECLYFHIKCLNSLGQLQFTASLIMIGFRLKETVEFSCV